MPVIDRHKKREYQNTWKARRREEWLAVHGPCVRCKRWDNLQVVSIDPTKRLGHGLWSWAKARREAELTKGQVLCDSCRKKLQEAPHGSTRRYEKHGCRCDVCRAAHAQGVEAWRERKALREMFEERRRRFFGRDAKAVRVVR